MKLSNKNALDIYNNYLSTEKLDYQKTMRKPCRSSIHQALKKVEENRRIDIGDFVENHLSQGGKLYFWSDLHINHQNIIKYSDRPFDSVEEMNKTMLDNYKKIVTDNDIVVFGGDIAFGDVSEIRTMLASLPGKKILVVGNHDFDNKNEYKNYHVFDAVCMAFSYSIKINNDVCNLLVTHYPIDSHLLPINTLNIHGHIHQHLAQYKNINISVEHTNYSPKDMKEVIEYTFLNAYKQEELNQMLKNKLKV